MNKDYQPVEERQFATDAQIKYAKYLDKNVKYYSHPLYFKLETAPREVVEAFIASARKLPTRKQLDYAITIAQAVNSSVDEVKKMNRQEIEAFIDEYGTKMRLKDAFCGEHFYRNVDRGHDIGIDFHDLT